MIYVLNPGDPARLNFNYIDSKDRFKKRSIYIPLQNKNPELSPFNRLQISSRSPVASLIASKTMPNEYMTPSMIKLTNLHR